MLKQIELLVPLSTRITYFLVIVPRYPVQCIPALEYIFCWFNLVPIDWRVSSNVQIETYVSCASRREHERSESILDTWCSLMIYNWCTIFMLPAELLQRAARGEQSSLDNIVRRTEKAKILHRPAKHQSKRSPTILFPWIYHVGLRLPVVCG